VGEIGVKYRTILADPPWPLNLTGSYLVTRHFRPASLVYPTMTTDAIKAMPVSEQAESGAHLWLWVTNQFLREGFDVMDAWGFKYHQTITWAKPSGCGNYFISRTEHILFGYKDRCEFNKARYVPNVYYWPRAGAHSTKPPESYALIESISDEPRLELFARPITPMFPKIDGWHVFGNEVESDVNLVGMERDS
jgi:N6-adenosine-specific RNA methylase IME4